MTFEAVSTVADYSREAALASLLHVDPAYPPSDVTDVLRDPANEHLLGYVYCEAFTHVFPGDTKGYPHPRFFADLDEELRASPSYHLWAEIPLCKYRCHFCQFPIMIVDRNGGEGPAGARRWVDANIAEARLWLEAVPALREVPVGEFCLFGGTPTAIPIDELSRLVDFYADSFVFDDSTSLRAEGSPDTLTPDVLDGLRALGSETLTFGVQSFDDELLKLANRRHSGREALDAIENAFAAGFRRVDGDLVWGLPGQTTAGFVADVRQMIDAGFSTIVIIKLHLRPFQEVPSAIGNVMPTPWEDPRVRQRIAERGYRWPSLGEQYQMRAAGEELLGAAGYYEHPTTYFPHASHGPERWRSLNLDQDKQFPQIGIGLGGYSWSHASEANVVSDPVAYMETLGRGVIPLETVTGTSPEAKEVRSVRMALSTCRPLTEEAHRARFPDSSLFAGRWGRVFESLEGRGLATVDRDAGVVALTRSGATLVEAIINTEIV